MDNRENILLRANVLKLQLGLTLRNNCNPSRNDASTLCIPFRHDRAPPKRQIWIVTDLLPQVKTLSKNWVSGPSADAKMWVNFAECLPCVRPPPVPITKAGNVVFNLVFRNLTLRALKRVLQSSFKVCGKVLLLAHRMVGQTPKSDCLGPTW